ncbi:glomulin [Condylostylus longicornis]|uniref:glomulin n=1 Tax=Condylostylus longicornis TaxID=2530218 RepID=UPI00244E40AD|nr:glomulin [Condylostylus longicornis]
MNDDTFDPESNLLQLINQLIAEKHYDGIEILFNDKRNINILIENTADFVELCRKHLTDENFRKQPALYFACENLLKIIAKSSPLTEALFELLDIIDTSKSDDIFTSALKALQICLLRKESDRKSLEWGLNEVIAYVSQLEYPEFLNTCYDEKQMALFEQNEQIHKILINYITITLFYEPILQKEIQSSVTKNFKSTDWNTSTVISSFLLQLLGRPLALLDLTVKEKHKTNTHSLQCAQQLTQDLCKIYKNPYYLLNFVEARCRWRKDTLKKDTYERFSKLVYMNIERFPLLSFAVYYYLLIGEEFMPSNAPRIYNPIYIFESCLYLVEILLKQNEALLHYKGLILCHKTLNNLDGVKINSSSLDLKIYADFSEQLTKIVIFSEHEILRKIGVNLFKQLIMQFDIEGQSVILKKLLETTEHSGLLGYFITIFKNLVAEQLDQKANLICFCTGTEFKNILLKLCCKLKKGSETDLIEHSDHIISTLNALRYFAQRDTNNLTGFWNFVSDIETEFLNPLRDGLNFSRAHYKAEEYRVQNDIQMEGENELFEKFMINDENLPNFNKAQKLDILTRSIVTFDLLESLIARVNECLDNKRKL